MAEITTYEHILELMRTARESLLHVSNLSEGDIAALYNEHWLLHVAIKAEAFQRELPQADRIHCAETAQMMALESFEA